MGAIINHAERPQCQAIGREQGHTGIKAQIGLPDYQRVIVKALIESRIGHHHHIGLGNSMGAKRYVAAHIHLTHAHTGGEKNVIAANHVDGSHRHIKHARRNAHHRVQALQHLLLIQPVIS